MTTVLVRDVMTIGVPVCSDTETCGAVAARLSADEAPVVVALNEAGMACGWAAREQLAQAAPDQPVSQVLAEAIPQLPPDIPASAAAALMRDWGTEYAFLMHTWPGEARPSAVVSRQTLEQAMTESA